MDIGKEVQDLCNEFFSGKINDSEFEKRLEIILAPDENAWSNIGKSLHTWTLDNAFQKGIRTWTPEVIDTKVKKAVRMWELIDKVDDRIQEAQVESMNSFLGTIPFKAPTRNMASFYINAAERIKKEMLEGSQ